MTLREQLKELREKRITLRKEILEELSNNLSNGVIEILESADDLTGKEAYAVGSSLTRFLTEKVGERKVVASLLGQWEFLYPIEVKMTIDHLAAVQDIANQNLLE